MKFRDNDSYTWSASDLYAANACEFGFLRSVDVQQKRLPDPGITWDPMRKRAGELGDIHEQRILAEYRARFGDGVIEIAAKPLPDAVAATVAALERGADVVFQAAFLSADGPRTFVGYADFVVRQPNGRYRIEDSKLARSAKGMALLQMAAYAGELRRLGFEPDDTITIVLGDGMRSDHELAAFEPLLALQRDRLFTIVAERTSEGAANGSPVAWGDERYAICGSCDWCAAEVAEHGDVLAVASLTRAQRTKLRSVGVETVQELAQSVGPVAGIGNATLERLRAQAALQLESLPGQPPPVRVVNASALAAIPEPSPGDIFFDFEGDPLYSEGEGDQTTWGLDYLWGWVDANGDFQCLWAHDFAQERDALVTFLAMVSERRAAHPDMHIYHYASYERTHLLSMAARWGVGEQAVDDLLREHVLVDLYPVVKKSLLVGSPSYSIKKLELLYMGAEHREGVDNAGDSMVEYANACDLRDAGDDGQYQAKLNDIQQYNAYDCVSTLKLRDWLAGIAQAEGVEPARRLQTADAEVGGEAPAESAVAESVVSDLEVALLARAEVSDDEADAMAYRIAAASVDFYRRDRKSFWHDHYARLVDPKEDWVDTRDVFDVRRVEVISEWSTVGKTARPVQPWRVLHLVGVAAPGSRIDVGQQMFSLYEPPTPIERPGALATDRGYGYCEVVAIHDDGVDIKESAGKHAPWAALPTALTPGSPPNTANIEAAIAAWGLGVEAASTWPRDPASDLLRRIPPRLVEGRLAPADAADSVSAVVNSLLRLDRSYLAVQGPPGTGKTYVGSRVIARLVQEYGWKVAVVAQSHKVIEHMLDTVVEAGVAKEWVGKECKKPTGSEEFTVVPGTKYGAFFQQQAGHGYVFGGTMWPLTNRTRVDAAQFDLLVVDEAGQFALADMIAAAECAKRVLLLGDPQQLPRVLQGVHPAPADHSALDWLSEGHDVLPTERGYFLPRSRRMHAAVAAPVSRLAYGGQLESHPDADARLLAGIEPGLVAVPIAHSGNSTYSPDEAAEVVRIVAQLLGTAWTDPSAGRVNDPLTQRDFIVVTPYNAQRTEVRRVLDAAGLTAVPVGTVDKFQGQEAVVSIVSLAASSADDVPRGMEFLINRNRLNVAISRAKWAAYLVYSPELLIQLPQNVERLAELGRFAGLVAIRSQVRAHDAYSGGTAENPIHNNAGSK